jgi:hypothetical protein
MPVISTGASRLYAMRSGEIPVLVFAFVVALAFCLSSRRDLQLPLPSAPTARLIPAWGNAPGMRERKISEG